MADDTTHWEEMKIKEVRAYAPELGVSVRSTRGKLKPKRALIHEMRTAYWAQQKKKKK